MNAKQGFHWKTIENKPDNWEKLHHLIQSTYMDKTKERDKYWKKGDLVLEVLLGIFPDLAKIFTPTPVTATTQDKKKKGGGGGKKGPSKKEEIMNQVEKDIIKKDLLNIRFDKFLRPLTTNFSLEITFVIMIVIWNFYVAQKPNIDSLILLDSIISLNRIIDAESDILVTIPALHQGIMTLRDSMNSKINESMYTLLFQNPVLLIESTADKRKKSITLYKEQTELLDKITNAITLDEPILMGNQMPTGTGKSFLAVPLAQKICKMKRQKTVLFACSNELVNQDIACTALLGDDIHLWMSALIRDENNVAQVLLRPYKRCFPSKWKQVYKLEDDQKEGSITEQWKFYVENTGKYPDIVVADLEACYELLKASHELGDPFIAYIDEFISDEQSNKMMAKICKYLPKHTVLLSAILPTFEQMGPLVQYFCQLHGTTPEACLHRVKTNNVPITCAVIDQRGQLRMPHHLVKSQEDLDRLLVEMHTNPRIRRCYTAKHVYYWAKTLESCLGPCQLDFMTRFPDIGKIQNSKVVEYAWDILNWLFQNFQHLDLFLSYRPTIRSAPDRLEVFKKQTSEFEGKTLFISNDTFKHLGEATTDLYDDKIRWSSIVNQTMKNRQAVEQKMEKLAEAKVGRDSNFSKLEMERKMAEIAETKTIVTLPGPYVLNSKDHYLRFHPEVTNIPAKFIPRTANVLPDVCNDAFSDDELLMLASGIGFYDKSKMTSYQRNLIMTLYKDLFFVCSCKDIVFGTNLPNLVNVFITKEFAEKESIAILYQLMGRVGRMGRSYHANIILDDDAACNKILSLDSNIDDQHVVSLMQIFLDSFN
jgi:hypothetical protein